MVWGMRTEDRLERVRAYKDVGNKFIKSEVIIKRVENSPQLLNHEHASRRLYML